MTPAVLLVALLMGLARAAAPGPTNAEAIRLGAVKARPRAAVVVHAGALAGDLGWAVLALLGLAMMLQDPGLQRALAVAGAVLLAGSGLGGLRAAATETGEPEIDPMVRRPGVGPFGMGVAFAGTRVLSPVLWLGVGSWLAQRLPVGDGFTGSAAFLAAFAAGGLAWAMLLGGILARAPGRVTPGVVRAVDGAAGVVLLGLAIVVLAGALAS